MDFRQKNDDRHKFELYLTGKFIRTCKENRDIENYQKLAEINEYAILKESNSDDDRLYEISWLSLANAIAKRHDLQSVIPSLQYFYEQTKTNGLEEIFSYFKSYLSKFENSFWSCFKVVDKVKSKSIKKIKRDTDENICTFLTKTLTENMELNSSMIPISKTISEKNKEGDSPKDVSKDGWWARPGGVLHARFTLRTVQKIVLIELLKLHEFKFDYETMKNNSRNLSNGMVILPCGAGKTLLIMILALITKGSVLIICNDITGLNQLKNDFDTKTTNFGTQSDLIYLKSNDMSRKHLNEILKNAKRTHLGVIVVTTRTMLQALTDTIKTTGFKFKLLIWDEAHHAVAKITQVYAPFLWKCSDIKIGFTATNERHDGRFASYLFGPKLFELVRQDMLLYKEVEDVIINIIKYEIGKTFTEEYLKSTNARFRTLLEYMNPMNLILLRYLVHIHAYKRNEKIIIFVNRIHVLDLLVDWFGWTFMSAQSYKIKNLAGKSDNMPEEEREYVKKEFNDGKINVLITTLGDTGMDVPNAQVVIDLTPNKSPLTFTQKAGRVSRQSQQIERNELEPGKIKGKNVKSVYYFLCPQIKDENKVKQQTTIATNLRYLRSTFQRDGFQVYTSDFILKKDPLQDENISVTLKKNKNSGNLAFHSSLKKLIQERQSFMKTMTECETYPGDVISLPKMISNEKKLSTIFDDNFGMYYFEYLREMESNINLDEKLNITESNVNLDEEDV